MSCAEPLRRQFLLWRVRCATTRIQVPLQRTTPKIFTALGLGCLSTSAFAHGYPEIALGPVLLILGGILVVHGLIVWALLAFKAFKWLFWLVLSLLASAYEGVFVFGLMGLIVGGRIDSGGEVLAVLVLVGLPVLLVVLPVRQYRRMRGGVSGAATSSPPLDSGEPKP